jgi:orotate phosphoribosyltransferase
MAHENVGDPVAVFDNLCLMKSEEILALAREQGALLEGHFLLSSGLHSPAYFQCAKLLQRPEIATRLGTALAEKIQVESVDLAIAPALGGVLVAHEVARALGVRAVFAEREPGTRALTLRRGFAIEPGERAVVLEDVVTTGGSLRETMKVVRTRGGLVIATGALVDRSQGKVTDPDIPFGALARLEFPTYEASECPMCQSGSQPVKPGSRPSPR